MIQKPLLRLLAGSTILAGGSALGATLIYEPFDFPTGDLSTESSDAWGDTGTLIDSPGITYGSLATAGNRVSMSDDTSWTLTGSALDGFLDDGDTLWFSVLMTTGEVGTNPDFGFAFGTDRGNDSNNVPLLTTNGGNALGFRVKGNNGGLIAASWAAGVISNGTGSQGLASETTYLIVGELTFGVTDTITLYLPDTDLNLGSAVSSLTGAFDQTAFKTITFMNKANNLRDKIDEIRFGETYADVTPAVPESGAFLLLSLAGLGLLRRRR